MKKCILVVVALSLLLTACKDTENTGLEKKNGVESSTSVAVSTEQTAITEEINSTENPSLPHIDFNSVTFENNSTQISFSESQERSIILGNILPVGIINNSFFYFSYNDLLTIDGKVYDRVDEITINKYDLETGDVSIVANGIKDGSISYIPFSVNGNKIAYQIQSFRDDFSTPPESLYYTFDTVTGVNELIGEADSSGRESFHTIAAVSDTQFMDFRFVNNSDGEYNLEYNINVFNTDDNTSEEIISETIKGDADEIERLCKVTANDDKVYILFAQGNRLSDLVIKTYNANGEEIENIEGNTPDSINSDLLAHSIYDFNVFGDFVTVSYTGGGGYLLQKSPNGYEIVGEGVQFLKPPYSSTSDKYIFYRQTVQTGENGTYYHNKVYLYDNGEVSGLVETDMAWMTADDEKLVYCTPEGVCYSVNLE